MVNIVKYLCNPETTDAWAGERKETFGDRR
jgi:hypothetical protein